MKIIIVNKKQRMEENFSRVFKSIKINIMSNFFNYKQQEGLWLLFFAAQRKSFPFFQRYFKTLFEDQVESIIGINQHLKFMFRLTNYPILYI